MLVCLQQLLALYFAIIYGWQLSSSERSLAAREIIHIFQGFYRFRFIFFHFFHFCLDKYMFTLSVTQRVSCTLSSQPLLPWRHLNTVILTNFEKLKSISNIFQEIHDFVILMDPVVLCIYLRTIGRHFSYQGNVGHPTSKLLKFDLVQTLDAFRATFYCQVSIYCFFVAFFVYPSLFPNDVIAE